MSDQMDEVVKLLARLKELMEGMIAEGHKVDVEVFPRFGEAPYIQVISSETIKR